jgi:2-isopropylmalate synthase
VSGEAVCALFRREYFDVAGPVSRVGAATLRVRERDVKIPPASVSASGESYAEKVAEAVAEALGVAAQVSSFETASTASGETAVFVGCRVGDEPMRFGVAVNANAAQAVVDAIVSAVNRARWTSVQEAQSEAVAA